MAASVFISLAAIKYNLTIVFAHVAENIDNANSRMSRDTTHFIHMCGKALQNTDVVFNWFQTFINKYDSLIVFIYCLNIGVETLAIQAKSLGQPLVIDYIQMLRKTTQEVKRIQNYMKLAHCTIDIKHHIV